MAIIVNPTAAEFKQMLAEKENVSGRFLCDLVRSLQDAQLRAGGYC